MVACGSQGGSARSCRQDSSNKSKEELSWMVRMSVRQDNLTRDRKSTRLNSSHSQISYAVFCLKKKKKVRIKSSSDYTGITSGHAECVNDGRAASLID